MKYRKIKTEASVWAVIKSVHPELVVHSSYSAPEGDFFGDSSICRMMTEYGFKDSDMPLIGAETTWDRSPENDYKRENEKTEYWFCIAVDED